MFKVFFKKIHCFQIFKKKKKRRDSSYLIRELPPKSEFIIFVNLSPFQTFLYKIFLEKRKSDGQDGNSQPISAYSILNRICNHPDVLKASLSESNTSNEFDEEDSIDSTKSYDFLSEYFQAPCIFKISLFLFLIFLF